MYCLVVMLTITTSSPMSLINKIVFLMKILCKRVKKWTLKIQKSKIVILVLNQSPISAVFSIVRFTGDPKTALTGDLLYTLYCCYQQTAMQLCYVLAEQQQQQTSQPNLAKKHELNYYCIQNRFELALIVFCFIGREFWDIVQNMPFLFPFGFATRARVAKEFSVTTQKT